jgi:heme oxygenase
MNHAVLDLALPRATAAPVPTLHERLQQATAADHQAVEDRVNLMGIVSLARYQRVLVAFHGFWPGIEDRIHAALPPDLQTEWAPRWRGARLANDLLMLAGESPAAVAALPACDDWPMITHEAEALGALYVIEGSSLGARHISRHLQARLGLEAASGASFFAGHGDQTGAWWLRFKEVLRGQLATPEQQALAVEGARQTFASLNRWFALTLAHG